MADDDAAAGTGVTRRNRRVTLRWLFVIIAMFAVAVACNTPQPEADDGAPDGVRVQQFHDSYSGRPCVIFTHDTSQGASIAVWCK